MLISVKRQEIGPVYKKVLEYKRRFSGGIYWRLKKHAAVIERHLNPGEEVLYAFPAQKMNRIKIYLILVYWHLQIKEF